MIKAISLILINISILIVNVTYCYGNVTKQPVTVGTTFSQVQCEYLDMDWKKIFVKTIKLDFDIIRIGAYWNRIERKKGVYDFRELDWQIAKAKQRKKKLLLTLGMKAPRWPEYFIPDWVLRNIRVPRGYEISSNRYVRENVLKFIKEVVIKYQNEDVIYAWQVENEPFDKSGPNDWRISEKFSRREMALVKELDTKKRLIVVNTLVNSNKFLRFLSAVYYRKKPVIRTIDVADIPALNVYEVIGNKIGPFKRCYRSNTEELKQYLLQFVKKTKSKKKSYGLLNYKQSHGNRGIWFIKAKSF